jgi:hypothetical protein
MCDTEDTRRRQINKTKTKAKTKTKTQHRQLKKEGDYGLHKTLTFIYRRIKFFYV